ncbi:hypothetical protein K435DRAFT_969091 [Dendrothele bispora CBS 962.96]|uniref:BAG domain-containing protein n=1 Tax=Dendrothele bispora (strain CBS 962.96) TaxID=1314807 RepID=A0A4S8LKK1_DENBC|nr:hypothetical protein K435DRAFT_969091 [Dendrothele bispora CBS 962.96]
MSSPLCPQYHPLLSNDLYSRPSLNPRDRYLAALAEAKAAEADYLAAEALQQEEEALRRRLEEIQLQKRRDQTFHHSHPIDSYSYDRPSQDRFSPLHRETQEEELRQVVAARQRELEAIRRRRELEEAEAIVAPKRTQEERKLELLNRRREGAEAIVAPKRTQEERKLELLTRRREEAEAIVAPKRTQEERKLELLTRRREKEERRLLAVLREEQQVEETRRLAQPPETSFAHPVVKPVMNPQKNPRSQLQGRVSQAQSTATQPRRRPNTHLASIGISLSTEPSPAFGRLEATLNSLFERVTKSKNDTQTKQTAAAPQKPVRSTFVESQARPNALSQSSEPQPSARAPTPATSRKEKLENHSLSNKGTVELHDTIQSFLNALTGEVSTHSKTKPGKVSSSSVPPASSSVPSSSFKGKEKSVDKSTRDLDLDATESTSSTDILKSIDAVRNIETSFLAVQSEFVFPPQLDFTPTSSRSPSRSRHSENGDESLTAPTSSLLKLAYTSRNHSVRYYEQNLSTLLARLDGVESFGNEEVRGRRKEVVARVEKALEDLDGEIEGRWKSTVAKEEREEGRDVSDHSFQESSLLGVPGAFNPVEATSTANVEVDSDRVEVVSGQQGGAEALQESVSDVTGNMPGSFEGKTESEQDDQEEENSQASASVVSYPSPTEMVPPSSLSASSSVATIRPSFVEPQSTPEPESRPSTRASDLEDVDTFLIPASAPSVIEKRPSYRDDGDSDWSEVEA